MRYLFILSFLIAPFLSSMAQNDDNFICIPTFFQSPAENFICLELEGDYVIVEENLISTFNCSVHVSDEDPHCVEYVPLPAFENVADSIIALICSDNLNICDTISYYIYIGCLNPVASDDEVTIGTNNTFVIDVLKNDYDVCGKPLSLLGVTQSEDGLASIDSDEKVVFFQPNEGFEGTTQIDYGTFNECGLSDQSTITINVDPNYEATFSTLETTIMVSEVVDLCPSFINIGEGFEIQGFTSLYDPNITIIEETKCLEYSALAIEYSDVLQVFACRTDVAICDTAMVYIQVVNDTMSAINQLPIKNDWFVIAPNPIKENLDIYFEEPINEPVNLVVFDLKGQKVVEKTVLTNNDAVSIALDLSSGTYFLEVRSSEKRSVEKIIISE